MAILSNLRDDVREKQSLLAGLPNPAKCTQSRNEKRTDKQVLIYFKNNDRAGDGVSAATTNPFVVERRTLPERKESRTKESPKARTPREGRAFARVDGRDGQTSF